MSGTNLEHGRVGDVERQARLGDELARLRGFLLALVRQRYVLPPGETVLVVPGTLAVPSTV